MNTFRRWAIAAVALMSAHAVVAQPALVARGEYIAKIGGCASCHTAPRDGVPFAGGRGMSMPFGTLYSTNITPDPQQGIGRYTLADFDRALRQGVAPGGRHLYPAMPYTAFAKLSDDDVAALYVYLRQGVAASDLVPPANRVPFPFDQRWGLRFWKMLFMPAGGVYAPRAERDAEWNRGAYLVQSAGHCGACHTPRGVAYQERGYDESSRHFLTGQVNDNWYASNLTGDAGSGLGRTGAQALSRFLKTGHSEGVVAFGSMAEEISLSLQYLSDEDARAMARYLKTLPARSGTGSYAASERTARTAAQGNRTGDLESIGAATYRGFCAQCHQADGKGLADTFPRLAGNPSVLSEDATSLIRLVVQGGQGPKTAAGPAPQTMPGFASTLSDVQMAQVLTHVRQAWGNDARPVTTSEVTKLRKQLQP